MSNFTHHAKCDHIQQSKTELTPEEKNTPRSSMVSYLYPPQSPLLTLLEKHISNGSVHAANVLLLAANGTVACANEPCLAEGRENCTKEPINPVSGTVESLQADISIMNNFSEAFPCGVAFLTIASTLCGCCTGVCEGKKSPTTVQGSPLPLTPRMCDVTYETFISLYPQCRLATSSSSSCHSPMATATSTSMTLRGLYALVLYAEKEALGAVKVLTQHCTSAGQSACNNNLNTIPEENGSLNRTLQVDDMKNKVEEILILSKVLRSVIMSIELASTSHTCSACSSSPAPNTLTSSYPVNSIIGGDLFNILHICMCPRELWVQQKSLKPCNYVEPLNPVEACSKYDTPRGSDAQCTRAVCSIEHRDKEINSQQCLDDYNVLYSDAGDTIIGNVIPTSASSINLSQLASVLHRLHILIHSCRNIVHIPKISAISHAITPHMGNNNTRTNIDNNTRTNIDIPGSHSIDKTLDSSPCIGVKRPTRNSDADTDDNDTPVLKSSVYSCKTDNTDNMTGVVYTAETPSKHSQILMRYQPLIDELGTHDLDIKRHKQEISYQDPLEISEEDMLFGVFTARSNRCNDNEMPNDGYLPPLPGLSLPQPPSRKRRHAFTPEEDRAIIMGIRRFTNTTPGSINIRRFTDIFNAYRKVWRSNRTPVSLYDHWRSGLRNTIISQGEL